MARRPPAGSICVHCAKSHEVLTWDHGIPLSWYPVGSAENEPRIKAPSCGPCNGRLSKLEQEALIPLAMSISPQNVRAVGVAEAVHRAMDPSCARDERDARARAALRAKVKAAIFVPTSRVGEFPGCEAEGRSPEAMKLSAKTITEVCIKIARVAYWSRYAAVIPSDMPVTAHIVGPGADADRIADMIRGGDVIDVPPGVFVAVRRPSDRPDDGVLFVVDLWGQVRLFMSAVRSNPA